MSFPAKFRISSLKQGSIWILVLSLGLTSYLSLPYSFPEITYLDNNDNRNDTGGKVVISK